MIRNCIEVELMELHLKCGKKPGFSPTITLLLYKVVQVAEQMQKMAGYTDGSVLSLVLGACMYVCIIIKLQGMIMKICTMTWKIIDYICIKDTSVHLCHNWMYA